MYVAVEINLTLPLPFYSANQCANVTLAVKAVHENVWYIMLICPCKVDPITSHFNIVNLGFTGV